MGIEPTSTAWEAVVLPMNYIRVAQVVLYHNTAAESSENCIGLRQSVFHISGAMALARWPVTR